MEVNPETKSYIGKDYVKNGYLIPLELESWNKISKKEIGRAHV